MIRLHRVHRLAIIIGFAAALTFTIAQPVLAACTTKESYTNAALAPAGRIGIMSRPETRDSYMKSGYASLAKAQAQKCTNQAASDRWAIADSWLGVYAARDRLAQSQRSRQQSCRSLHLAEAREGLALSWLELARVHARLLRTSMFQRDRAATESYVRSSVEATAHSSEECSETLADAQ